MTDFDPTPLEQTGTAVDLNPGPVERPVYGGLDRLDVPMQLDVARAAIQYADLLTSTQFTGLGVLLGRLDNSTKSFCGLPALADPQEVGAMRSAYDSIAHDNV